MLLGEARLVGAWSHAGPYRPKFNQRLSRVPAQQELAIGSDLPGVSRAALAAVGEEFPHAEVTVDWFHVVQLFTKAVDDVRKVERKTRLQPAAMSWAVL